MKLAASSRLSCVPVSSQAYAQLVESFRNEEGKPRQRTVATIGRVDDAGGAVDALLKGLLRAKGVSASKMDQEGQSGVQKAQKPPKTGLKCPKQGLKPGRLR